MTTPNSTAADPPFNLDDDAAYRRWREAKLADYPTDAGALVVEVGDPRDFTESEYQALLARVRKTNMAVYAGKTGDDPDKAIPHRVGARFGLTRLDQNWLADDDGLTSLTVNAEGDHPRYIPYTDRPIKWHTDGYYNAPQRQINALLLHCVHSAAEGGENALMDHEVAYILMRDENPDYVRALMQGDAMTIPPGTDATGGSRGPSVGPVFSIQPGSGDLHMRYTARKRNIQWKQDPLTLEAVAWLEGLLDGDSPYIYRARLEPGMGLVSNNVLHDRAGFRDLEGHPRRLLYRARYYDRIAGTGLDGR